MKTIEYIKQDFIEAADILQQFMNNENSWNKIEKAGDIMVKTLLDGKKIVSCGNGGSMCDAMHFAEELSGRFRDNRRPLAGLALSDSSHITCVGNDYGFEYIFSKQIDALCSQGDTLLCITSSGNSRNIIEAAKTARAKGMNIIALTGKGGGKITAMCDVEIRAPYTKYSDRAQEIHEKVIHSLVHYIELKMEL